MNLSEMINEVRNIVQDSYWTDQLITQYINQGLKIVATGVMLTTKVELTPPLPQLYTCEDITVLAANDGMVDLPEDFDRDLVQIQNSDSVVVSLDPSYKRFLMKYPKKETGDIYACARLGKKLMFRAIPAVSESLTLHYYRKPDALISPTDEPECLPEILHKPVLIGHACVQIFNQIEDGLEGKKANAEFWYNEFRQGLFSNLSLISGDYKLPDFYSDATPRIA